MKKTYLLLSALLFLSLVSYGQTGPAGVGNATGASGQPENIIWLDAGTIGVGDGVDVATWTDISGNGEVFSASSSGNLPSFSLNQVNSLPSVVFDDSNAERLKLNPFANMGTTEVTTMVVFATANNSEGIISYSVGTGNSSNEYLLFDASGMRTYAKAANSAGGSLNDGINTFNIFTSVWQSSGGQLNHYKNGSNVNSTSLSSGASLTTGGSLAIGGEQDNVDGGYATNQDFDGEIAEIIMFKNAINDAQRIIIENYLSEKYNIAITNDFFSMADAAFNNDLVGIGTSDGSNTSSLSGFSDALQIEEAGGTLNASNEFVLLAHDNTAHSQTILTDFTDPDITDRWARSWFLEASGGVSAELRFDFGVAGLGAVGAASDYVLLYRATTGNDYTRVLANSISIENGDQVVVNLSNQDIPTGYYTLGRGAQLVNTTYYSFQSGNWEDALTWTTDPSGDQRFPPTGNLPTAGDNMVILTGRTVRMATDDNDGVSLTVDGRLDIENTTGHNYFSIAGNGIISVEGSAGIDNFPSGSTSDFADPIVGGTVMIEAGNFDLDTDRVYNNVIINLASPTNIVTLLSDYTINGNLTIQTGILQINDDTETTALNINAFGNVQIDASGEIHVGTANARHQFNFYGDFTNNGRVEFTNRTMAIVNAEDANGIVDANFLNDDADQTINCNGVTNFYRIEIDKGVDETYILDINASSIANFNLFGFASEAHAATAQLTDNANALGLIRGTVRLNANVDIDELNDGGNYNLSEGSRLWVNGGSVTTAGNSIVPYGTIRVSDGFVVAPGTAGITTRDNGTIIVEGGTVTTNQIRTSVLGAANIGGYFQSGGTVNVTGGSINNDYYTFSLTYTGNTFNMSGGVLNVSGSQPLTGGGAGGGIFINSDPGNISVTGGTVIMENSTNTNFKVTSKAPFWNVIMRSSGGTATEVELDEGLSGPGGSPEAILNPELLVSNDLTIEGGVLFDHNGFDVEIGSDFTIQTSGDYLFDAGKPNTTTINGVDDATLDFQNRVDGNGEQRFWNLMINKPTGRVVSLGSGKTDVSGSNNNLIRIDGDAFKVLSGIFDNGLYSVRIFSDSLVNYDILGVYDPAAAAGDASPNGNNDFIKFTNGPIQVVTADTSRFGNVRFNNSTDIIDLTSDVYIERLQYRFGRMNLGEHNLKIDALDINLSGAQADWNGCGGCFSVEDMFITDGNASDGGLSIYVPADGLDPEDGNATFDLPFGIGTDGLDAFTDAGSGTGNSKYTPASATLSGVTDDGYITIRPVDKELATTDPSGGDILSYYWTVDFEDFSTLPTVEYTFTYYDNDLDGSANEATFAAGKVLTVDPFTRNYEDDPTPEGVDDTNNTITFNGAGDVGFTLEEANYTAGEFGRFVGAPEIYYSRSATGNWTNNNIWSTIGYGGAAASSSPGAGDVVHIGFSGSPGSYQRHRVTLNTGTIASPLEIAELILEQNPEANGVEGENSRLIITPTRGLRVGGSVTGNGEIQYQMTDVDQPTLDADLGEFADTEGASFIMRSNDGDAVAPTNLTQFPRLSIPGRTSNYQDGRSVSFAVDITCQNLNVRFGGTLLMNTGAAGDIVVTDSLRIGGIGSNNEGRIIFQNSGNARSISVGGDFILDTDGNTDSNQLFVQTGGTDNLNHQLNISGDIQIRDADALLDLFTADDGFQSNITLNIEGNEDKVFNSAASVDPDLSRLVLTKDSKTNSFTINTNFTLGSSTNGTTKAITLTSGILALNDPAIDINLTTGGDSFSIPADAGLQLTQGTANVNGSDSGIELDGCIIIDGGTLDMDDAVGNGNNFIEYSASGNALLEISSGTLDVGSQIRGITSAETGVLRYRQTGGDVRIGTQAGPENTRGMLQIYNTGSEFTYTGGTLTIERHQDTPTVAALFLDPDISDVTGSTITIFNANTPAGQNDFRINSVIDLENLTINGTNTPSAEIDINPLTVSGLLTIETGAALNGNARTLTVGGDFDNDGTYDAQGNETIFNSTGSQQITGSGTNTFFRFTKSEVGTLDLTNTLDVADLFTISDGTLSDNGFSINLAADAVIDGIHSSTAGNGLVFAGGSAQELRRSAAGSGTLGVLTINNANGVTIPDGNGYDFNVDGGLRLENGVFNVGGSVIALGLNALITPVNSFGVTNMIRTNSSFTDGGVSKTFPASFSQDFTFPVGQSFYTPVIFDLTSGSNTSGSSIGTITILPANEFHPTINDGSNFFGTGDVNNVLQYYWTVQSSGITGLTTDMTMGYDDSQVLTADPGSSEADYIAARILAFDNPTDVINKFTTTEVNETTNLISFNFSGASDNGITGDYFAGIDEAIPNNVATYTVDVSGNFGDDVYDNPVPGGGAPTGAVIIVPNTFTLTLDSDNASFYRTEIQDGGILEVDNSTNHRLGQLSGTGTLRILSDGINANLPAFSGNFLSCSGGGLEYGGTGSYSVLSGITSLRNLSFIGTGDREFPNNNVTVCEDLVINGSGLVVDNANNRDITVENNFLITEGTFNTGTGDIEVDNNFTINGGIFNGENNGDVTFNGDVTINGGTFNTGTGGRLFVKSDFNFISGSHTSGSGTHRTIFNGTSEQDLNGDFTGSGAFYRFLIANANGINISSGQVEISSILFLNNGLIRTNDNDFSLLSNASVSPAIGSENSYINGRLSKTIASANGNFQFPIGSGTEWRPASVNDVSAGGLTWEAQYFQSNAMDNEASVTSMDLTNAGDVATISNGEYWKISDGNVGSIGTTATVGLSWGLISDVSSEPAERQELEVMIWNSGLGTWDNLDGAGFSAGNTDAEGRFTAVSSNTFSERIFTLGSASAANPLPITLTSFTGRELDGDVELKWVTSSEINNDYFELQRSSDGLTYEVIATVEGNGTTNDTQEYTFIDTRPSIGKNYYRLKQVDFDGQFSIADQIVVVDMIPENSTLSFKVYPNPTDDSNINLRIEADQRDEVHVTMFDMFGRVVVDQMYEPGDFSEDLRLVPNESLNQGIYIITIEQFGRKSNLRLMINE